MLEGKSDRFDRFKIVVRRVCLSTASQVHDGRPTSQSFSNTSIVSCRPEGTGPDLGRETISKYSKEIGSCDSRGDVNDTRTLVYRCVVSVRFHLSRDM